MEQEIQCIWSGEMEFGAEVNGHTLTLDADAQFGGQDRGPRPKPLLLVALAGCTGMDVVSILKKMKVNLTYFNVRVYGELTEEHPKFYHKIHIIYEFKGQELPSPKLERAIELSQERYCGVSALLKKGCELTHEMKILE